jgi:hypothetical protein
MLIFGIRRGSNGAFLIRLPAWASQGKSGSTSCDIKDYMFLDCEFGRKSRVFLRIYKDPWQAVDIRQGKGHAGLTGQFRDRYKQTASGIPLEPTMKSMQWCRTNGK